MSTSREQHSLAKQGQYLIRQDLTLLLTWHLSLTKNKTLDLKGLTAQNQQNGYI